jgi:ABC-2 type transport system ATP-binding protein
VPPAPAVACAGLTKRFGAHVAVADLDLEVAPGEVVGLLGPNGAGKSTTIRMLLDLVRPTAGTVRVLGRDPRRDGVAARREIGYVPGAPVLPGRPGAGELLTHLCALRGGEGADRVAGLAERLDLDLGRRVGALSRGNRQKVVLVQAFAHRPRLLILDEPTSGLDPLVQRTFHAMVREAAQEGAAVLLSSHVLSEVERMADRVGILREGRMVTASSVEELTRQARRRLDVTFATPPPGDAFAGLAGIRAETRGRVVSFTVEGPVDPLVKALAAHEVLGLTSHEADLEDVFLRLYREGGDAPA